MVGITGPFAVDLGKPKEELKIKIIYIYIAYVSLILNL
jgi:hypothetical protein